MVMDLFTDFRDGSKLLDLLEVMSGQRIVSPVSAQPLTCFPTNSWYQLTDTVVVFCRVGREAGECFSTEATLRKLSPF